MSGPLLCLVPLFNPLHTPIHLFAVVFHIEKQTECSRFCIIIVEMRKSMFEYLLLLSYHTFSVSSLHLKKLWLHDKSVIDLLHANPACSHQEVPRSTGHIMVTTRCSDQQGSKSRQEVIRLYKHWHRPMSKRFIKPPYCIPRVTSINSDCCRLPTISVLSNSVKITLQSVSINTSKFLNITHKQK